MEDSGVLRTQRRLAFPVTDREMVVQAYLTGRLVALTVPQERSSELAGHLSALGVDAQAHETHGYTVAPAKMSRLWELPDNITVEADFELEVVWQLAMLHGAGRLDSPAILTLRNRRHHVRWEGASGEEVDGYLSDAAVAALMHANLPFTATSDAWESANRATRIPVAAGTATVTHSGHILIDATHPNQIEAAPIPGLWKVDQRSYGAPLPYLPHIRKVRGISWDTPPQDAPRPAALPGREHLDDHVAVGAYELLRLLESCGSSVVSWPNGSGRRMVVLAALRAAEALPARILCHTGNIWSWRTALAEAGYSDADAQILTYGDISAGVRLDTTPAIVFDDFTGISASLLAQLDLMPDDTLRVGLTTEWPQDASEGCLAMRAIRPQEFGADRETALLRYPLWPARRADEHVSAYQIPPPALPTTLPRRRRFSVSRTVSTERQVGAMQDILAGGRSDTQDLRERLSEVADAGTTDELSPKIAEAVRRAGRCRNGESAVVCSGNEKARRVLARLLRGRAATVVGWDDLHGMLTRDTGPVILCDYPDDPQRLWHTLHSDGGREIVLLHLDRSIDDLKAGTSTSVSDLDYGRLEESLRQTG